MYAGIVVSLLLDQLVVTLITRLQPGWITGAPRWFSVLTQPWSSLIAILLVLLLMKFTKSFWLGFALGGAISNLVTFYLYHQAIDYIPLSVGIVTNLADILIVGGLAGVALTLNPKKKTSV
jgi:lipoprotein signal peptidase